MAGPVTVASPILTAWYRHIILVPVGAVTMQVATAVHPFSSQFMD